MALVDRLCLLPVTDHQLPVASNGFPVSSLSHPGFEPQRRGGRN